MSMMLDLEKSFVFRDEFERHCLLECCFRGVEGVTVDCGLRSGRY